MKRSEVKVSNSRIVATVLAGIVLALFFLTVV